VPQGFKKLNPALQGSHVRQTSVVRWLCCRNKNCASEMLQVARRSEVGVRHHKGTVWTRRYLC